MRSARPRSSRRGFHAWQARRNAEPISAPPGLDVAHVTDSTVKYERREGLGLPFSGKAQAQRPRSGEGSREHERRKSLRFALLWLGVTEAAEDQPYQ